MPGFLKKQDFIIGVTLIIIGILMFLEAVNIKSVAAGLTVVVGSDFLPKITAVLISIFGIIFIIKERIENRLFKRSQTEETGTQRRMNTVFISIGLLFGYVFLMPHIGFMISTALYLLIQITVLAPKEKRNYLFAVISVISSLLIYFAFVNIFSLMLPRGTLF